MKLIALKQYMKMSKPALIRKITKSIRVMPKRKLAYLCYEISKSKLPRLRTTKRKALDQYSEMRKEYGQAGVTRFIKAQKRKTKRKFSRKQLAAQRLFAKRARAGTLKRRRR